MPLPRAYSLHRFSWSCPLCFFLFCFYLWLFLMLQNYSAIVSKHECLIVPVNVTRNQTTNVRRNSCLKLSTDVEIVNKCETAKPNLVLIATTMDNGNNTNAILGRDAILISKGSGNPSCSKYSKNTRTWKMGMYNMHSSIWLYKHWTIDEMHKVHAK